ncbi:class Ib ribonucleoside-diphosphate reductase assembly flavoprotein NrdI, partial [Thermocatellispora tengchongensis]|uniref:class Ib ribonucleoside-diphosphate reductase assembly flavoprotein NrdI n=1 Tax=Thermocatellispora tengchongensis TaxID=1073253 RepID=UPI0031ED9AB7
GCPGGEDPRLAGTVEGVDALLEVLEVGRGAPVRAAAYCLAAMKIAAKCDVPLLYRFELMGTSEDVDRVREGLEEFWTPKSQNRP